MIVEVYCKNTKMLFLDLAQPTLQNSGIFHDSIRPHLTSTLTVCRQNRGDPSSLIGFMVRYKYYKNIVVLVWPGAAHAPIAV